MIRQFFDTMILVSTDIGTYANSPGLSGQMSLESPGLPYGWPILPDKYDFEPFLRLLLHSTLKTHPQMERISIFENRLTVS